jgi:hypothetical protein
MALPAGTYLVRATPGAALLSYQELAAHLSRAARAATGGGGPRQVRPQKPVTSEWERPILEGP